MMMFWLKARVRNIVGIQLGSLGSQCAMIWYFTGKR